MGADRAGLRRRSAACVALVVAVSGTASGDADRPAGAGAVVGRVVTRRLPPAVPSLLAALAVTVLCIAALGLPGGVGVALAAAPAAAAWARRASVLPAADDRRLPLALDLMAAALRSGRSPAEALWAVAPVTPGHADRLRRVAGLLQLGAAPADAGRPCRATDRSDRWRAWPSAVGRAASGSPARWSRRRARCGAAAHARRLAAAHRAGVTVLAPLGACFLPAFVCLGIVPVIVGVLGTSGLTSLPGAR